jgi:hypothetical protein
MSRNHARLATRVAMAFVFLIAMATPASAAERITFSTSSSPFNVTVGLPVAYPVTVTNSSGSTINHITVTGHIDPAFELLFVTPSDACGVNANGDPVCAFDQLQAGKPAPQVIFYYLVPDAVDDAVNGDEYDFTATATVGEGPNDNPNASHQDTFVSAGVTTIVKSLNKDFVSGHAVPGIETFSTGGIDCAGAGLPTDCNDGLAILGTTNKHGTSVTVPQIAEVSVEDEAPGTTSCPPTIKTCFGAGSSISVADGAPIASGITVTMRWDLSELPSGMTWQKLNVIHIFDTPTNIDDDPELETFALITDACADAADRHCFLVEPFKLGDKDIQATFILPFNGVSKGW